jgi:hypothetical protein
LPTGVPRGFPDFRPLRLEQRIRRWHDPEREEEAQRRVEDVPLEEVNRAPLHDRERSPTTTPRRERAARQGTGAVPRRSYGA